jgi:hypothetical protein
MRKRLGVFVAAVLLSGCQGAPTRPPVLVEAEVVFSRWSPYGGYGEVGWVRNVGGRTAVGVRVKTAGDGRMVVSYAYPANLMPGQEGWFRAAYTPGPSPPTPEIIWIVWE